MRLKHVKGSEEAVVNSALTVNDFKEKKGKWNTVFGNDHPIRIEIGMGKGQFITELAKRNPDVNYIGIERYSSVLLRAIQKVEAMEEPIKNLIFICMDAADVCDTFAEQEIDRIYLNFSDPWPKDRHAKRRLESRQFLSRYNKILKKEGKIEFKTDNRILFDFAVEEVEPAGWKLEEVTYDLHSNTKMNEGNIMTEYEEKFSALGNPIYKYIISR
ncbi:MAG: tRNA (guanosine(46)-N7)-methyltransferase TrmB [Lachnospiraceae bacterium]|nr:tRNA (guanosine(46)-N7)-methyltransferase TrmB [Lachnospiraceae bacterium]